MSPDNNCESKKEEMNNKVDSVFKSRALSFEPIIIPSCIPFDLQKQAFKYSHLPSLSPYCKSAVASSRALRQYDGAFIRALRFSPASTSRPPGLPFIPGMAPGVRTVSPVRTAVMRDARPHVFYYDQMVPAPYVRFFRPTSAYEEPIYINIFNY